MTTPHTPPTQAELDAAKAFNDHHGYLRDYMARPVFLELARLTKEVEELRKDKERLDKIELEKPNVLCLCKFDPETMERLSGHLWEVGEKGVGYTTLREAIDKYDISSGMDIDRTENAPASGDAPVPEITLTAMQQKGEE